MALVGLQYEPVKLDVNEVCFDEEQDIRNTCEKSKKDQNLNGCTCGKWDVMQTNVKSLSCPKLMLSDTFHYWIWDTMVGIWLAKEPVE